jgi:uncharacterized protein (TIGR03437 family)
VGKILLACGLFVWAAPLAQPIAVTITTTPSTLTFNYTQGVTALPAAQTVSVKASSGNPTYLTSIAPAGTFWVTSSPDAGSLPGTISVVVNPNSLAVGQYGAQVTLTVAAVGVVVVSVVLNVNAAPSTLTLSQDTLNLNAPPDPPAQIIGLTTNGAPISFTATSGVPWISVSPTVGVVLPGEVELLTIGVTGGTLAPQPAPYTAKITIVATGANVTTKSQSITVNLTVASVTPAITNVWPPNLPVNGGVQTLTVRGTSFYAATLARIQGVLAPLTTKVLSPTTLLATIPANLLTASGTLQLTVVNPMPGGPSAAWPIVVASAPTISGLFNAASYATATVSPGELVTIFGTNIGPAIPASMNVVAGYADITLGAVNVTIDGQNCPLLYVSENQVTVQVPYEATVGAAKTVTLTNGGNPVAMATIDIAATVPGIFSADGSGQGQAAALNTTVGGVVTLNSGTTPAPVGATVSLYLTGEGGYNLVPLAGVSNTGYIIPVGITPLPTMLPLPTVVIGGVDASAGVSYAGVVPGSIIGVLQINVVVPAGTATGAAVPVTVTIGGATTQANLTLGIHP